MVVMGHTLAYLSEFHNCQGDAINRLSPYPVRTIPRKSAILTNTRAIDYAPVRR
jgi:hypothetical protein